MTDKSEWGGARKGAGRSSLFKGEHKTKIALSLVDDAVEHLNKMSDEQKISRSDVVNNLILKEKSSADD